jgi:histidinol phosphatase-like enzyme
MTTQQLEIWQKLTAESETNLEARIKFDNLIKSKMSKPFKSLRGRTILVNVPKRKESTIQLSAKDEDAIMAEAVKMWNKLTVYAVGDKVEDVKEGDQVYIRTSSLNMEVVERIDVDGEVKLVLNEGDVVIIW